MAQQFELSSPPSDGVSRVLWLSDTSLVVSSWDGSVALHEVGAGSRRAAAYAHKGGVAKNCGAFSVRSAAPASARCSLTQHAHAPPSPSPALPRLSI
jgi:hypothetical protein